MFLEENAFLLRSNCILQSLRSLPHYISLYLRQECVRVVIFTFISTTQYFLHKQRKSRKLWRRVHNIIHHESIIHIKYILWLFTIINPMNTRFVHTMHINRWDIMQLAQSSNNNLDKVLPTSYQTSTYFLCENLQTRDS